MGIVRFALRLPHTFYVLAAIVVVLGVSAVLAMPVDIFPEINVPVVTIIWTPSMSSSCMTTTSTGCGNSSRRSKA